MVAINTLDVDKNFNTRIRAVAEEVTTTGFNLKTETWADTRIYAVGASWTACSSRETLCWYIMFTDVTAIIYAFPGFCDIFL